MSRRTFGNSLEEQRKLNVRCVCGHTKGEHALVQARDRQPPRFSCCLEPNCDCPVFRERFPAET